MTWDLELGSDEVGILKCHLCLETSVTYVMKQNTFNRTRSRLIPTFLTLNFSSVFIFGSFLVVSVECFELSRELRARDIWVILSYQSSEKGLVKK